MVTAGSTNGNKFAIVPARKSLDRLAAQWVRASRSPVAEEVHDLRVAIRRFAQVLRTFKPCFPAKEVKRIQRVLKKHMALAGEVRDLDIAARLLGKSKLAEAAALRSKLQDRRKEIGGILAERLQNWARRRTAAKWRRRLLLGAPYKPETEIGTIEEVAHDAVPRLVRRFFARGKDAANEKDLNRLHQLRIAAKKLRYTLEVFAPLHESVLRARIEQLKKLQSVLGDINDAETVRNLVLREDAGAKLAGELEKKRDHRIEEFRACWKTEFAGAGTLVRWRKDLTSFPRDVLRKPPVRSESSRRHADDSFQTARVAD